MSNMMTGVILQTQGENAIIRMQRHSACAGCGACKMADEKSNMNVEALNSAGGEVGDLVEVELHAPDLLKAAFIAYSIPLIALVAGITGTIRILEGIGYAGNVEAAGGAVGVLLLGVSYLFIRLNEHRFKKSKKYSPVIVKILPKNS